jgi:hypothetical protein
MSTDEQLSIPNPPSAPYMPMATRTGLLLASIIVGVGLITYLLGLTEMMMTDSAAKWVNNSIAFLVPLIIIIVACFKHRKEDLGGYIGLGRCIGLGTVAGIVAGLVVAIWTYSFFGFLAPETIAFIKTQGLQEAAARGQDVDMAEEQMEKMPFLFSPGFFAAVSFVTYLFLGFLGGLLGGLFAKKDRPYM